MPGVAVASAAEQVPLQGTSDLPFDIVGQTDPAGPAGWATISPGFFEVFNIAVKRGRGFDDRDTGNAPPVVVINETMAKQFWKGTAIPLSDPLNARIKIGRGIMKELQDEPVRQIIGIVADVRDNGLQNAPRPVMYVPQAQIPDAFTAGFFRDDFMNWVVRTRMDPHKLAPIIQEQLRQATGLPVSNLLMMDEVVSLSVARQRFSLLLMAIFGGAALLLAAMGIYGLMAYTVAQRTHEIGIRLALGAEAGEVRRMIVKQGMRLALIGVGVGLAASFGLARTLESLLFGVKARDPLVFVAVPIVLGAVALWAVWLPAPREIQPGDPVVALQAYDVELFPAFFVGLVCLQGQDVSEQQAKLEHIRAVNLERAAKLPSFVADEVAIRYRSKHTDPQQWEYFDTIESEIAVRGADFARQNVRLNGKPWTKQNFPNFTWSVDFGAELKPLFRSKMQNGDRF